VEYDEYGWSIPWSERLPYLLGDIKPTLKQCSQEVIDKWELVEKEYREKYVGFN